MKLNELIKDLPVISAPENEIEIKGLTMDSRLVEPGYLFVAEKGLHFDGHDFAQAAWKKGASAILTERPLELPIPQVLVADTKKMAGFLASRFYLEPASKMRVLAITGTKGKTTTSFILHHLLDRGRTALLGSICFKIGQHHSASSFTTLPSIALQEKLHQAHYDHGAENIILEVSSHALKQRRVAEVDFDLAVFTNFSRDHLDFHHTMEEYLQAKSLLFSRLGNSALGLKGRRYALVNGDDPAAAEIKEACGVPLYTYGCAEGNFYRAVNIKLNPQGSEFTLLVKDKSIDVKIKMPGKFNVYNALAAIAVAHLEGLSLQEISEKLLDFSGVPGRLQKLDLNLPFQVIVDYAHTEESLRQTLLAVREFSANRVLLAFGCTGDRDKGKRPKMGQIAYELADFTMVTSDDPYSEEPESIIDEIMSELPQGSDKLARNADRTEAIAALLELAEAGDTVLLAGKGHEQVQIIKGEQIAYSDEKAVEQWLHRKMKKV